MNSNIYRCGPVFATVIAMGIPMERASWTDNDRFGDSQRDCERDYERSPSSVCWALSPPIPCWLVSLFYVDQLTACNSLDPRQFSLLGPPNRIEVGRHYLFLKRWCDLFLWRWCSLLSADDDTMTKQDEPLCKLRAEKKRYWEIHLMLPLQTCRPDVFHGWRVKVPLEWNPWYNLCAVYICSAVQSEHYYPLQSDYGANLGAIMMICG